jgi:hypothetical protein
MHRLLKALLLQRSKESMHRLLKALLLQRSKESMHRLLKALLYCCTYTIDKHWVTPWEAAPLCVANGQGLCIQSDGGIKAEELLHCVEDANTNGHMLQGIVFSGNDVANGRQGVGQSGDFVTVVTIRDAKPTHSLVDDNLGSVG